MVAPSAAAAGSKPFHSYSGAMRAGTLMDEVVAKQMVTTSSQKSRDRTAVWASTEGSSLGGPLDSVGASGGRPSGCMPRSSGCRTMSSDGSTDIVRERQASMIHAACQPNSPTRKATGIGRTNAAVLEPMVAAATARPRYLRNQRGTTAALKSSACPPDMKPVTTPTSSQNCQTSVTWLVRARQLQMKMPVMKTVRRAPPGESAKRVRAKAPNAPHQDAEEHSREDVGGGPVEVLAHGVGDDAEGPVDAVGHEHHGEADGHHDVAVEERQLVPPRAGDVGFGYRCGVQIAPQSRAGLAVKGLRNDTPRECGAASAVARCTMQSWNGLRW